MKIDFQYIFRYSTTKNHNPSRMLILKKYILHFTIELISNYFFQISGLEQPTLENYFQQSKFYPPTTQLNSTIAEYLPLPIATGIPIKPHLLSSPLSDLPGPSGLQTPKTTRSSIYTISTSAIGNIAKLRKRSRPALPAEVEGNKHRCRICHKGFTSVEKLCKHEQSHIGEWF